MFDKLKRFRSVFFILFIFICSVSAQITENSPETKPDEQSLSDFEKKDFSVEKKFEDNSVKKFLFQQTPADKTDQDTVAPDDYRLRRGEKELNIELGYSPFQPTFLSGDKEYDTSGRSFGLVSLRWGRVIGTPKRVTYEYQIEVTPLAVALKNEVVNPAFQDAQTTPNVSPTIRRTTYGVAVLPVGFRFLFRPNSRLKPYVAVRAGFIVFNDDLPLPNASAFNFAGDFGGGLQYQIKRNKAISFGYKYFHISNISLGETNPGYNANVFYVGYSFFYK